MIRQTFYDINLSEFCDRIIDSTKRYFNKDFLEKSRITTDNCPGFKKGKSISVKTFYINKTLIGSWYNRKGNIFFKEEEHYLT